MEEITFDEAFGQEGIAKAILASITEKARTDGIQIGIPWSKDVYDYLLEASAEADIEEILGIVAGDAYSDMDIIG